MPYYVSVVGGLVVDLITVTNRIPDEGETIVGDSFSRHLGGKGANSAVAVYRASRRRPAHVQSTGPLEQNTEESQVPPNVELSTDDIEPELKPETTLNGQAETETKASDEPYDADVDIEVRMIGAVGDDDYGDKFYEDLKEKGVNTQGIRKIQKQSCGIGAVTVETYTGNTRIVLIPGANHALTADEFTTLSSLGGPRKPDLLIAQLELPRKVIERVLMTADSEGVDVLLNPAPANYLLPRYYRMIQHLILNETEASMLTGRNPIRDQEDWKYVVEYFLQRGVKNVVLTLGEKGAYYADSLENQGIVEAEKDVNVIDATGAGDTFVGTYAVEYVKQSKGSFNIKSAVARACKASARVICKLGAQEGIPWADEIEP